MVNPNTSTGLRTQGKDTNPEASKQPQLDQSSETTEHNMEETSVNDQNTVNVPNNDQNLPIPGETADPVKRQVKNGTQTRGVLHDPHNPAALAMLISTITDEKLRILCQLQPPKHNNHRNNLRKSSNSHLHHPNCRCKNNLAIHNSRQELLPAAPLQLWLESRQGGDIRYPGLDCMPGHHPGPTSALQYRHEAPPRHGTMCRGPSPRIRSVGPVPIQALPVHSLSNLTHQFCLLCLTARLNINLSIGLGNQTTPGLRVLWILNFVYVHAVFISTPIVMAKLPLDCTLWELCSRVKTLWFRMHVCFQHQCENNFEL